MFQELKRAIITEDDYYIDDRGKQQLKIGGWRKFAIAYGLTTELLDEAIIPDKVDPREWVARVVLGVKTKGGRKTIGVGYFSTREVKHKYLEDNSIVHPTRTDKSGAPIPVPLEHITTSRAYTRALKRGVQDMIGPVEQEEDEIEESTPPAPKAPPPTPPSSAAKPLGTQQRVDSGQRAVLVHYLETILGEDLVECIDIEEIDGELLVKLDRKFGEHSINSFIGKMMKWGYGCHETAQGITARISKPKV